MTQQPEELSKQVRAKSSGFSAQVHITLRDKCQLPNGKWKSTLRGEEYITHNREVKADLWESDSHYSSLWPLEELEKLELHWTRYE